MQDGQQIDALYTRSELGLHAGEGNQNGRRAVGRTSDGIKVDHASVS